MLVAHTRTPRCPAISPSATDACSSPSTTSIESATSTTPSSARRTTSAATTAASASTSTAASPGSSARTAGRSSSATSRTRWSRGSICRNEALGVALTCSDCVDFHASLYVRRVEITNLRPQAREIRLFFHQDFRISESDVGDTAAYDPATHAVVHYKGNRYFLVNLLGERRGRRAQVGGRPEGAARQGRHLARRRGRRQPERQPDRAGRGRFGRRRARTGARRAGPARSSTGSPPARAGRATGRASPS